MRVVSLSGASGTGKSTSAIEFAFGQKIDAIIDDGILIVRGEKVAGTSAKFEKNALKAVRRAIFEDDVHKEEVRKAIQAADIEAILIIGTSEKMTKRIANRLELGEVTDFYRVEDIRTEKEIQLARFVRQTRGQHIMPIPYKQVEQNFFKRLIQRGKEIFTHNRVKLGETTIVHPDFHQETITIAPKVYLDLIREVAMRHAYVTKVHHYGFSLQQQMVVTLEVNLLAPVHYDVVEKITDMQQSVSQAFLTHFLVEPEKINVVVRSIETTRGMAK
ncbi:MAG: hypothetical protein ABS951_10150 [Solibacillus sp.]